MSIILAIALAAFAGAADAKLAQAIKAGDKAAVQTLLQQRVDVNAPEADGTTALHWAVRNDDMDLIDRLLRAGAAANSVSTEGETALMTASRTGNVDAVKVLLAHGADVNAKENWHGETALMWAVSQKH